MSVAAVRVARNVDVADSSDSRQVRAICRHTRFDTCGLPPMSQISRVRLAFPDTAVGVIVCDVVTNVPEVGSAPSV